MLRFLGVIDEEGKRVDAKSRAFVQHKDEAFASEFEALVREAYGELFELHGDGAWALDRANLTQFFRTSDHSTEVVGKRQAGTFMYLGSLSGHAEMPAKREASAQRTVSTGRTPKIPKTKLTAAKGREVNSRNTNDHAPRFGLTVRIEVNLPAEGDQQTYDRIFRSLRKNLIDGE